MLNSIECFVANDEARTRLHELIVAFAQLVTKGVTYHRYAKSLCCPERPVFHINMACYSSAPSIFDLLSNCPCIIRILHHECLPFLFFKSLRMIWCAS
jgi:hypothetical protein